MTEVYLLMSPPMATAILSGRKSMTRRLRGLQFVNQRPDAWIYERVNTSGAHVFLNRDAPAADHDPQECHKAIPLMCHVGDAIIVKETHWRFGRWVPDMDKQTSRGLPTWRFEPCKGPGEFRFDPQTKVPREQLGYHKRPSIFMPREAARIILEVTAEERCERVQDISEADSAAEGVFGPPDSEAGWREYPYECCHLATAKQSFRSLWDSIHGPSAWARNDWVRVIQFGRINP